MHWGWWVLLLVVVAVGSTWKYFFDIYSIDKAGSEEIAQVLSLSLPPNFELCAVKQPPMLLLSLPVWLPGSLS